MAKKEKWTFVLKVIQLCSIVYITTIDAYNYQDYYTSQHKTVNLPPPPPCPFNLKRYPDGCCRSPTSAQFCFEKYPPDISSSTRNQDYISEITNLDQETETSNHNPTTDQPYIITSDRSPYDSFSGSEGESTTERPALTDHFIAAPSQSESFHSNDRTETNEHTQPPLISQEKIHLHQERSQDESILENHEHGAKGSKKMEPTDLTIRIIVAGRSGAGVSSTIRELIGPVTKCQKPEGTETLQNIYEYTIRDIPTVDGSRPVIKLLDLPGFVDGRTLEQDAQILATLKTYIDINGPPNYFLALSRFDDNRIIGSHSLFVQFIKRLEMFEKEFLQPSLNTTATTDTVFLLTRLFSETKQTQRRPAAKIQTFRQVIADFSSFPSNATIVVGDNNAVTEHGAKIENGYYKLPNRQLYPKNVWEALVESTSVANYESEDLVHNIQSALNVLKDNRETEMKCEVNLILNDWTEYSSDADAFMYLLQQKEIPIVIDNNEINREIDEVFNGKLPEENQRQLRVQKTALQVYLQNNNFTTNQSLPSSFTERAAFFQMSPLVSSTYPALILKKIFGLNMPEYIKALTVGFGYDVIGDEISFETPFSLTSAIPSAVGYQIPDFMTCRKFPVAERVAIQSYSYNMSEYFVKRLTYLEFSGKENISESAFQGKVKEGFNIQPTTGENIASLIGIKEVRLLKCVLSDSDTLTLNERFTERVNTLTPVTLSDRDSVNDWSQFLRTYGSHIVVQGYGGGSLHGSVTGASVKKVYASQDTIESTLDSILRFSSFTAPNLGKPSYRQFGGEPILQIDQLYEIGETERDKALNDWEKSLQSNFDMLTNEFKLERISAIIKEHINPQKGEMVDAAIDLLLRGELKFTRKSKTGNSSGKGEKKNRNNHSHRPQTTPRTALRHPTQDLEESSDSRPTNDTNSNAPTNDISHKINSLFNYYRGNANILSSTTAGSNGQQNSPTLTNENDNNQSHRESMTRTDGFANFFHNNNQTFALVQQFLESGKKKNEMRHQQELDSWNRDVEDSARKHEERTLTALRNREQNERIQLETFQRVIGDINHQVIQDQKFNEDRIAVIARVNDQAERMHQIFMQEMARMEEEKRRKEIERCAGIRKLKPSCW